MSAAIDDMLTQKGGISEKEAIKILIKKPYSRDKAAAKSVFHRHMNHIEKHQDVPVKFNKKKEKYSAKESDYDPS